MSDVGDMVAQLIAAGTPPEVAARIVTQAFLAGAAAAEFRRIPVDETAEKRRAYDRERKRQLRGIPQNSTGHPQMSESASLSKEEDSKKERKREGTRGTRLPDKWRPLLEDRAIAVELLTEAGAKTEFAKFQDHWKQQPGGKGVKLDWDATWRNWVRRAVEYKGRVNGKAQSTGSLVGSIKRELDALEREDEADPPVYPSHIQRVPRR